MQIKPSLEEIDEKIKGFLVFKFEIKPDSISSTTPLLGRGIGLDSIEAMALAAAIEKEFDIEIKDDDLTVDLFKNISTLAEYVLKKITD